MDEQLKLTLDKTILHRFKNHMIYCNTNLHLSDISKIVTSESIEEVKQIIKNRNK